jgi:hypothetical protein
MLLKRFNAREQELCSCSYHDGIFVNYVDDQEFVMFFPQRRNVCKLRREPRISAFLPTVADYLLITPQGSRITAVVPTTREYL